LNPPGIRKSAKSDPAKTTYKAVKSGKEVSLVVDSFGKFKELP
jgi:hypothetical protein